MLNWVLYDDRYDLEYYRLFGNVNDIPVWEKDEVPSADMDDQSSFAGPVQAMTWQSRRIRLVPNEERTRYRVVNCYGDAVTLYNTDGFESDCMEEEHSAAEEAGASHSSAYARYP